MRVGLNLGYWGAGNDAENLALAVEADRLGYAVCWAAEAYGSDAVTVLAWVAAQTAADRPRVRGAADPGPHAGDDGDDRRHAGHPLGRPLPARARGERAAGLRGLARGPVRPAARAHPRVRRDRADGAAPRDGGVRGPALPAAAAGRAGQGAAADRPPGPARDADLPRRGRARRTWRSPARSPTAGWPSSSLRSTRRSAWTRSARRGPRPGEEPPGTRWPGSTSSPGSRSRSRTTSRPRPTRCAAMPRSTSAAWAAASRTSTTHWPGGWASTRPRNASRTSTSTAGRATPRRPCRWSSSTRPSLIGPIERVARAARAPTPRPASPPCRSRPPLAISRVGCACCGAVADALDAAGVSS